jgi:hypothetical protein
MTRRTLLTTAVVLIAGAFAPAIPAGAGGDPATFINNLGRWHRASVKALRLETLWPAPEGARFEPSVRSTKNPFRNCFVRPLRHAALQGI